MAKIYEWEVPVNGTVYHVSCQIWGNQYDFKLDGEHLYRMSAGRDEMCEQDVRIGGKKCQIVVYEGVPDVALDGILVGVEAAERKNAKRRKVTLLLVGILFICIGTFAVFSYSVMTLVGQPVVGGLMSAIFGIAFAAAGVWMLLSVRKKDQPY